MSCFFCESNYHLSQNCEIHESDESRKEIARLKNCCEFCLFYMGNIQAGAMLEKNRCPRWVFTATKKHGTCFTCLSTEHDAVFCPNRLKGPNLFIPNIDQILMPRFIQIFDSLEQYPLALSSPTILNLIPMKELKITKNPYITFQTLKLFEADVIVGTMYFHACNAHLITNFNKMISMNTKIYKPKKLVLVECKMFVQEFFQLLSPHIENIVFNDVKFDSTTTDDTVTLKKIFQHSPNIRFVHFYRANGYTNFMWVKKFMKLQNKEISKDFKISISSVKNNKNNLELSISVLPLKKICLYLGVELTKCLSTEELQNNFIKKLTDYLVDENEEEFVENYPYLLNRTDKQSLLKQFFLVQYFMINQDL